MLSISVEQVNLWRTARSETQVLEFKEAKNQFDFNDLCEYCVAIGNEGGEHLIFGVADIPPRPVVGTSAFLNVVKTAEQIFNAVGFRVDVCEVIHPDGRVVVMQVPGRPRGTAFDHRGKYLMRSGQQLKPMSEDKLRSIFKEGEPAWLEDYAKENITFDPLLSLLDIPKYYELLKLTYPVSVRSVIDQLVGERLIDNHGDRLYIRRLGALLLAKNLNEFPDPSGKAPRVIRYRGNSKMETTLDQFGHLGYAVGFQRLVKFMLDRAPQNEVINDALRTNQTLPELAIRELVANALIHQDFSISGSSVMCEIYDNRIEFSNPGYPVFPADRFIDGNQSRNERLADIMRRFGICEEKGSGIDRVVTMAEVLQLPAPEFRQGQGTTVATLFGPRSFENMDRQDRIRACYQHCVLRKIMSEKMTNITLRERFKLLVSRTAAISQIITATIEHGLIEQNESGSGSRKFARYAPYWA